MDTRRLYKERTNLIMRDIADQPVEEYVAIFEGIGDRAAVSFAKFTSVNGIVILFGSPTALAQKEGPIVASFPVESNWVLVRRERLITMTGEQWETHKVDDAKCKKAEFERVYGNEKLVKMVVSPSGDQVIIPAEKEDIEQAKAVPTKKPYDDSGMYR